MPQIIGKENTSVVTGQVLHTWEVAEYAQHERPTRWYVIMLTIGLFLVGYGLFTNNFLFALIIVLFAIIIFLQSHQKPHNVPFSITDLGVIVNNRFYAYSEFSDFYIIYNPPEVKTLFLEPESTFRPRLRVSLEDQDPNEIKFTLRQFLSENVSKEDEPLSDKVAREWMIHWRGARLLLYCPRNLGTRRSMDRTPDCGSGNLSSILSECTRKMEIGKSGPTRLFVFLLSFQMQLSCIKKNE